MPEAKISKISGLSIALPKRYCEPSRKCGWKRRMPGPSHFVLTQWHPHALPGGSPAESTHAVRSATYRLADAGIEWRKLHSANSKRLSTTELRNTITASYKHGWATETISAKEALSALRFAKRLMSRPRPLPIPNFISTCNG